MKVEVVVLGIGGVGAFALRALAQQGVKPLGIEQFVPGHDLGSSHGGTRVYRHAYFEHPDYVPLLLHSSAAFGELQEVSNRPLMVRCGTLLLGRKNSKELSGARQAADEHRLLVRALNSGELRARYPQFDLPEDYIGLLEPGGGFVRPEAAIEAAVSDARRLGAELRTRTTVQSIREDKSGVHLTTNQGEIQCERLVVCAGAWSQKLIPQLQSMLQVTRQIQAWITPRNSEVIQPERLPTWFLARDNEPALYGIPADPLAKGAPAAKLAVHGRSEKADPETLTRTLSPGERQEFQALAKRWMPRLAATVSELKVCMYTMTRDGNFLVDRAPGMERTWFAAGLSGHGFKLTPALGQVLSDLALDGASDLPAGFLGWRDM